MFLIFDIHIFDILVFILMVSYYVLKGCLYFKIVTLWLSS